MLKSIRVPGRYVPFLSTEEELTCESLDAFNAARLKYLRSSTLMTLSNAFEDRAVKSAESNDAYTLPNSPGCI